MLLMVFSSSLIAQKASYMLHFPVDTGRKLNVLCKFNLRPVSTVLVLNAPLTTLFFTRFLYFYLMPFMTEVLSCRKQCRSMTDFYVTEISTIKRLIPLKHFPYLIVNL